MTGKKPLSTVLTESDYGWRIPKIKMTSSYRVRLDSLGLGYIALQLTLKRFDV